jgi:predicted NBD/HSP70 family sugar kinase
VLLGLVEIHITLCDAARHVLSEDHIHLTESYTPTDAADVVAPILHRHCADRGITVSELAGLGLAVSAPVSRDGTVLFGSLLRAWNGVRIGQLFHDRLGSLVHVDNESHCGALYEMTWGAAKGEANFVKFKFDLGTGGAVVLDGEIRRGANGFGGELAT